MSTAMARGLAGARRRSAADPLVDAVVEDRVDHRRGRGRFVADALHVLADVLLELARHAHRDAEHPAAILRRGHGAVFAGEAHVEHVEADLEFRRLLGGPLLAHDGEGEQIAIPGDRLRLGKDLAAFVHRNRFAIAELSGHVVPRHHEGRDQPAVLGQAETQGADLGHVDIGAGGRRRPGREGRRRRRRFCRHWRRCGPRRPRGRSRRSCQARSTPPAKAPPPERRAGSARSGRTARRRSGRRPSPPRRCRRPSARHRRSVRGSRRRPSPCRPRRRGWRASRSAAPRRRACRCRARSRSRQDRTRRVPAAAPPSPPWQTRR